MSEAKGGKEQKGKDKDGKPAREPKQQQKEAKPKAEGKAPREGRQQPAREAQQEAPRERKPARPAPVPRLQVHYRDTVVKQLMDQFGYKSTMQVPRIRKIVLNMGVGEAVADK